MNSNIRKILKWLSHSIYSEKRLNYSPKSLVFRFIANIIIAFILTRVFIVLPGMDFILKGKFLEAYLKILIFLTLFSEILILWDLFLEKILPVPEKIKLRIAIQTLFALTMLIVVRSLGKGKFILTDNNIADIPEHIQYLMLIIGYMVAMLFSGNITITRMIEKLMESQNELAEIKQEKLRMDYNFLQDQLNPHFLFNNLSALKSLIIQKKDEPALNFVQNFSDIYRYVLNSADWTTVKLKKEIEFVQKYVDINKERLDNGLDVEINICKEDLEKEIAPLSLQLLVENAIKHNLVDEDNKLRIKIFSDLQYLCVENNKQLIQSTYSTKSGQKNLIKRYKYLSDKEVIIKNEKEYYKVLLPLL